MNNQNQIPNFNLNNRATWRWNHRNLLNVPIEPAEADHIEQVANTVGGVRTLLETVPIPCLVDALDQNLPNPQPAIALRSAILLSAQDRAIINKQDAQLQMTLFLDGLPDTLRVSGIQRILIDKAIASWYKAKELNLNGVILQDNLFRFFNEIITDIPANNPLQSMDNAANYLIRMVNSANPEIHIHINGLVGILDRERAIGAGAIKTAIQKNIPAESLATSLNHRATNDIALSAAYIQLAANMINFVNAPTVTLEIIKEVLESREGVEALIKASSSQLYYGSLALGLHRAQQKDNDPEEHDYSYSQISNLAARIAYINLAAGLVETPNTDHVNRNGVAAILSEPKGSIALNLARYSGLDSRALALALNTAINNDDPNLEQQINYIKFLCNIVYVWPLRTIHKVFAKDKLYEEGFGDNFLINLSPKTIKNTVEVFTSHDVTEAVNRFLFDTEEFRVPQYDQEIINADRLLQTEQRGNNPTRIRLARENLERIRRIRGRALSLIEIKTQIRQAVYRAFSSERRMEPATIATLMKSALDQNSERQKDTNSSDEVLLKNLTTCLDIVNLPNNFIQINEFNDFLIYATKARSVLYEAKELGLTPLSIAKLIRMGNYSVAGVNYIKLVNGLISPVGRQDRLISNEINAYLSRENPRIITNYYNQKQDDRNLHATVGAIREVLDAANTP